MSSDEQTAANLRIIISPKAEPMREANATLLSSGNVMFCEQFSEMYGPQASGANYCTTRNVITQYDKLFLQYVMGDDNFSRPCKLIYSSTGFSSTARDWSAQNFD